MAIHQQPPQRPVRLAQLAQQLGRDLAHRLRLLRQLRQVVPIPDSLLTEALALGNAAALLVTPLPTYLIQSCQELRADRSQRLTAGNWHQLLQADPLAAALALTVDLHCDVEEVDLDFVPGSVHQRHVRLRLLSSALPQPVLHQRQLDLALCLITYT